MRFEVLGGKHTTRDGTIYRKGDVVESGRDLTDVFPNKFKRLADVEKLEFKPSKKSKLKITKAKATKDDATKDARGTDVTAKVLQGLKLQVEGLSVFSRGDLLHVYEKDETKPLNPKGLKPSELENFLAKYLEE